MNVNVGVLICNVAYRKASDSFGSGGLCYGSAWAQGVSEAAKPIRARVAFFLREAIVAFVTAFPKTKKRLLLSEDQ